MAFTDGLLGFNAMPSIDRVRGGKIMLHLIIPSQTYITNGACGQKGVTDEMHVRVEIDVEKLPLVNLSGYGVEEEQIGPDEMPYEEPYLVEHDFVVDPPEPNLEQPK